MPTQGITCRVGNSSQFLPYRSALTRGSTVTVGSNAQSVSVLLDTGESDLFFLTSDACDTHSTTYLNCSGGLFDPANSDTYSVVKPAPAFSTKFGDGSTAQGPIARDTIGIGGLVIDNVEFGLAEVSNSTAGLNTGILGLGYSADEAVANQYPNLPDVLKESGAINSRLYSVYLNELTQLGNVLFGGIDTSKYSGKLTTLDLIPLPGRTEITDFILSVTAIAIDESSSHSRQTVFSNASGLPVLLCIGCANTQLPQATFNQLNASFFSYVDYSTYTCSCDHRNDDITLQFDFGTAATINVPAREFITPAINTTDGTTLTYSNGTDMCYFQLGPYNSNIGGYWILGESVLRSVYLVFDLDNGQISLAQAIANSTATPTIHTVAAGPSGVANAISQVQTAPSNTYSIAAPVPANTSLSLSTSSTTSSSMSTGSNTAQASPSHSKSAGVGSVVQVGVGGWAWTTLLAAFFAVAAFTTSLSM